MILHIDSSILGEASVSRKVSAAVISRLRGLHPDAPVTYRDLGAAPLPHLSAADLATLRDNPVLAEFLAAETVVIGAGMYNFSVPSNLKAWIDRVAVAGKTFAYGETGVPHGLAGGKRVILALARGGFYGAGTPAAAAEHMETYLRAVCGFMGIVPEVIVAEGGNTGPAAAGPALDQALAAAAALPA